ncbi:MAG: class I tRNA ligase family protein, partial [Bacillota bacterium]|nr:class I tRNA ligase family protein [Bacillota bacterium]
VTHGWVVDGEGKKMSKSIGNTIEPEEIINKYGADILRLWVASSDYHSDIRISNDILKQLSEVYRKIRNTARFILGNISDFDPKKDRVSYENLEALDKFALSRMNDVITKVRESYETYEFYNIFHTIHNFCVVDLSNFYLDIIKDRLYCEEKTGIERRAAQTAMYDILIKLTKLLAPILAFTAEEIWAAIPAEGEKPISILMTDMPVADKKYDIPDSDRWEHFLDLREDVKKALEIARNEKLIGASLESRVVLYCESSELFNFVRENIDALPTLFIVSDVDAVLGKGEGFKGETCEGLTVAVQKASGEKCERCWRYSGSVGESHKHPTLCDRCADVVEGF